MKAIEQYFHVVLFIMLYKVVLTFKSVDENLVCDHSYKSYWVVISFGTVYYDEQGGSQFVDNISLLPFFWTVLTDHNISILLTTFCHVHNLLNYYIRTWTWACLPASRLSLCLPIHDTYTKNNDKQRMTTAGPTHCLSCTQKLLAVQISFFFRHWYNYLSCKWPSNWYK